MVNSTTKSVEDESLLLTGSKHSLTDEFCSQNHSFCDIGLLELCHPIALFLSYESIPALVRDEIGCRWYDGRILGYDVGEKVQKYMRILA